MSRLLLFVLVAAPAARSLVLGGVTSAATGDAEASQKAAPVLPVVAQKQLVSSTNCQTAAHAPARPQFLSTSAEYRDDLLITTGYCSATAHNQSIHGDVQPSASPAPPHLASRAACAMRSATTFGFDTYTE
jgi:hypothetical protein